MRKLFADTVAMVTFSWVIGMTVELAIAGLTFGQSVQSRLMGTTANIATGGIYGTFRDWLFRATQTGPRAGWVRQTCIGTLAFVLFQVPLYVAVLWSTGATLAQILATVGSVTIISSVTGGPYDWFLKIVRRRFRVA